MKNCWWPVYLRRPTSNVLPAASTPTWIWKVLCTYVRVYNRATVMCTLYHPRQTSIVGSPAVDNQRRNIALCLWKMIFPPWKHGQKLFKKITAFLAKVKQILLYCDRIIIKKAPKESIDLSLKLFLRCFSRVLLFFFIINLCICLYLHCLPHCLHAHCLHTPLGEQEGK